MLDTGYPTYARFAYGFLVGVIAVVAGCVWLGSGLKGCYHMNVLDDLKIVGPMFYQFWLILVPFCSVVGTVAAVFTSMVSRSRRALYFAGRFLVAECALLAIAIARDGCVHFNF